MRAAAMLAALYGLMGVSGLAQTAARPHVGANTRTDLPESRHRYRGAGNPAGSKLAKKAVKGTITIRQGW